VETAALEFPHVVADYEHRSILLGVVAFSILGTKSVDPDCTWVGYSCRHYKGSSETSIRYGLARDERRCQLQVQGLAEA
jgi:hypothetical protein